jgi:hypothetical protein
LLVDSVENMMMHGLANPKFFSFICSNSFVRLFLSPEKENIFKILNVLHLYLKITCKYKGTFLNSGIIMHILRYFNIAANSVKLAKRISFCCFGCYDLLLHCGV